MDGVDRSMSREQYDEATGRLLENMRQALAGRRRYVVDEEAGEAEEGQDGEPETTDG